MYIFYTKSTKLYSNKSL